MITEYNDENGVGKLLQKRVKDSLSCYKRPIKRLTCKTLLTTIESLWFIAMVSNDVEHSDL
jgi:hypothetical protein